MRHGFQPTFHNTKFFFASSQWTLLWLPKVWRIWENSFEKVGKENCPVGCLSLVLLIRDIQQSRPFSLPSQRNFPISLQRKTWYSIFGVDATPLLLKNLLLIFLLNYFPNLRFVQIHARKSHIKPPPKVSHMMCPTQQLYWCTTKVTKSTFWKNIWFSTFPPFW